MMATYAELAGAEIPAGLDSTSFAAQLTGMGESKQAEYLYWEFYSPNSAQAVRMGKWKALRMPMTTGAIQLFDLENDIGETTDLAAQHPDIVARAAEIMNANHEPSKSWVPEFDPRPLDEARRLNKQATH
jgi:arylsulfatase A-like enzyme